MNRYEKFSELTASGFAELLIKNSNYFKTTATAVVAKIETGTAFRYIIQFNRRTGKLEAYYGANDLQPVTEQFTALIYGNTTLSGPDYVVVLTAGPGTVPGVLTF